MPGVLYARYGGAWVPIGGGGVAGAEEVSVGPSAPSGAEELWYDTDAVQNASDTDPVRQWNTAWGIVARAVMSTQPSITATPAQLTGVDFVPLAGRRYRFTLNVRSLTGAGGYQVYIRRGTTNLGNNSDSLGPGGGAYFGRVFQWVFNADLLTPGVSANFNAYALMSSGSGPIQFFLEYDTSFFIIEDVGPISTFVPPLDPTPPWITPTLLNSWTQYALPYERVGYRKIGDVVYLRGLVSRSGDLNNQPIINLPVGYRAPQSNIFLVASAATTYACTRLDIHANGDVSPNDPRPGYGGFLSFSGIHYSVTP